jgi:2-C-methyl-D-erythritol 4-phosphate cytidylyltransferase
MTTYALIPSGGIGSRLKAALPKQYIKVGEKEIIAYTLEIFQNCDLIDRIIVAAQPEFFPLLNTIKEKYKISKLIKIVEGGKERQHSVYNALIATNANDNDIIAVHDAARPLLTRKILHKALSQAKIFNNVIVAKKGTDTLVSGDEFINGYLDRNTVYNVQTPQISRYKILLDAMKAAFSKNFIGTDESMLLYKNGNKIKITEGSLLNFKITTAEDLDLFKIIHDIETI